jgi:hypothetical protein
MPLGEDEALLDEPPRPPAERPSSGNRRSAPGMLCSEGVMPPPLLPKCRPPLLPVLPAFRDPTPTASAGSPHSDSIEEAGPNVEAMGSLQSPIPSCDGSEDFQERTTLSQVLRGLRDVRHNLETTFGGGLDVVSRFGARLSSGDGVPGTSFVEYSLQFRVLAALVIFLDAICMGLQVDESLKLGYKQHASDDADLVVARPGHWEVIEVCFLAYYTLEIVMRGVAERTAFLFGHERFWNWFDSFSVISSIVAAIVAERGSSSKITRLVRMTKGLRVLRALRFSGSLRSMVLAIMSSLLPLFWSMCVMFLIMYFFTVVLVAEIADMFERTSGSNDSGPDVSVFLPYYRSLLDTTLYLFMSISGGIDWQTMAVPLLEVDPVLMFVFVAYIFFMVLGVLNVVVGIFVAKAKENADRDREMVTQNGLSQEKETLRRMRAVFHEADKDGDCKVTWDEFREYLADDEVAAFFSSLGLDVNVAQALFVLLDVDDSEAVNIDEFVQGCNRLKGGARSIDVNMLLYQTEKLQNQFLDCMDSLGRELQRLAAAMDLDPDTSSVSVTSEKARTSNRKTRLGLSSLSGADLNSPVLRVSTGRLSRVDSVASLGSKFIQNTGQRMSNRLRWRQDPAAVDPRLQGQ